MKVQSLAKSLNVPADTVRYYTRICLLKPKKDPVNGYKYYSKEDQQRLSFILRARDLGFSLSDIKEILIRADQGDSPCPLVKDIIEKRLVEVKQKLEDMTALYQRMEAAVEDWKNRPNSEPCGKHVCHLIESASPQKGEH